MDLLNYTKSNAALAGFPNGMHAVVPAAPERGLTPGVIFALRNRDESINVNQQNRLHPYYLMYVGNDGQPIVEHTDVKRLLDFVRLAGKGQEEPAAEACRLFNRRTDDGRKMQHYSGLLTRAIRHIIDRKEQKHIDSLFTGTRTAASRNTITGLDDFELIAFLVIQDV